ncbi:hypothetical protein OF83DRAFT_1083579 [Amylostereum chailletii]|nr:hypothetical protein OF83DRAFT_1083579 [Amylostereum chailletii]
MASLEAIASNINDYISKTSLRCLMGFIVDLTLTMDTVFWLTQQDPDEPLTVKSLNTALKMYNGRKRAIHTSIRTWVEGLGSLERLQPDHAITRIERLIEEHRFNPEGNTRGGVSAADEAWLDPEELLTTGTAMMGETRKM